MAQRNMFAHVKNFQELEFAYMIATSPENVAMDGERPQNEIGAAYAKIKEEFTIRRNELVLGK